jgi:hypothetical protein
MSFESRNPFTIPPFNAKFTFWGRLPVSSRAISAFNPEVITPRYFQQNPVGGLHCSRAVLERMSGENGCHL